MIRIASHVDIAAPPERIWRFLVEPALSKLCVKGFVSEIPEDDSPVAPGKKSTLTIKAGGQIASYAVTLEHVEFPRYLSLTVQGKHSTTPTFAEYRLSDLGNATRLDYVSAFRVPWTLRLFGPLFQWFANAELKSFLKKLKHLAESPEFG